MRNVRFLCVLFLLAALGINGLGAQSLRSMSLNGSTGLYSIPSGRIGWERTRDVGLDFGYNAIINEKVDHIPKASLSLFKWVELSVAFDIQPDGYIPRDKGTDFLGGLKVQLPLTKTAIALGGNFQALNMGETGYYRYNAGQIYAAVTYAGQFFSMPAETTVVLGKTFREHTSDWDIDFGMGFDLLLFPNIFDRFVHWVTDCSNFSYSVEPFSADAWYRGVVNTGLRIDLSAIPSLSKFKFTIDALVTDAFDHNRAFSIGVTFGVPIV